MHRYQGHDLPPRALTVSQLSDSAPMTVSAEKAGDTRVTGTLRSFWTQMSAARRRHFLGTFAIMLLGAFAELLTIGSVLPFLALISDPQNAMSLPHVGGLFRLIGV